MSLALATPPGAAAAGGLRPPVRVLVCDDSAMVRGLIAQYLAAEPGVEVVARAANGAEAVEALKRFGAEVCVLDVEMPVMDGLAALPKLMAIDPHLQVVMASALTTRNADISLRALRLGAADYVAKPTSGGGASGIGGAEAFRRELAAKVVGLARLRRRRTGVPVTVAPAQPPAAAAARAPGPQRRPAEPQPAAAAAAHPPPRLRPPGAKRVAVLAVGASTGGPQALFAFVQRLGPRFPLPVLLTQHMPRAFTPILAQHLDRLGTLRCAEAVEGEAVQPGRLYVAPGDRHLTVAGDQGRVLVRLSDGPPENFCRPAVDPMLRSAVAAYDGRVLVAILTGMGSDGLRGAEAVVAAGGTVVAQDEASAVVWGMPGAVAQAGLCSAVAPVPALAQEVIRLATGAQG